MMKTMLKKFDINKNNLCSKWDELVLQSNIDALNTMLSEDEIIRGIEDSQDRLLQNKPTMGASKWFITEIVNLPDNYLAVKMEDGHYINCAIFKFDITTGEFETVLESTVF